ncbi:uncharacterized protein J4E88_000515 [Alternaria novae-zelandiae]|uniref:uncharacterized protein n=1 Tax=Alternaria novae-zelandiae TaxID=430562 RepID=UPI0020C591F3|nr:uncharacterized protein J4E88_000515 [Alternaria novae-zelandiae]KAI4696340.1 hypothetical protein J4E88_000515 [Alternaria novae-zelandiae]
MAIHTDYPGLTVEIYVDGKPLEEYEDSEEEDVPKTTTRYVECRSGAEFAIHTNFKAPFTPMDTDLCVRLDGVIMSKFIVLKTEMFMRPYDQSNTRWNDNGTWRASNFLFSDLSVVEEKSATTFRETLEALSSVGTISVKLTPILSYRKRIHPKGKKTELREVGEVSEESVKGDVRSHMIRLAPAHVIEPATKYISKKAKEPLVAFQFKYRSSAALKALGMIPRSPSPPPAPKLELVKKEELPEPTPIIVPNVMSTAATLQPNIVSSTPTPFQQGSGQPTSTEHDGLRDSEIIALIKHYRGDTKGLAGQSRKRLLLLLKHYEGEDADSVQIKQEPISNESQAQIKREHADDGAARGQGKKRKAEVIVLDD